MPERMESASGEPASSPRSGMRSVRMVQRCLRGHVARWVSIAFIAGADT